MRMTLLAGAAASGLAMLAAMPASAHDVYADDHAPIGVMADHAHKKGEVMFSLRYMHMDMGGNRIGTDGVSPDIIATTIPNRFAGMPGQPPTLRIVPLDMRTDMVMLGAMWAPSDKVTLMVMANYLEKEMDHRTYQGGMGTSVLGSFRTNPKGMGDTKIAALIPLLGHPEGFDRDELTLKLGVSIPTGSVKETAQVLTPMNMTPVIRTPYPMQTGSGSWDAEPSLTWKMRRGALGLGLQGAATIRLERNDAGYRFGDIYETSGWASYRAAKWISLSARTRYRSTGRVKGMDAAIMGPVQTANPDFQGGERIDLIGGVNLVSTHGALAGHRLGVEFGAPVYQDLNGPQMKSRWFMTLGWQKAF
ncbi:MAG: transporter [Blastomonas sp.]